MGLTADGHRKPGSVLPITPGQRLFDSNVLVGRSVESGGGCCIEWAVMRPDEQVKFKTTSKSRLYA